VRVAGASSGTVVAVIVVVIVSAAAVTVHHFKVACVAGVVVVEGFVVCRPRVERPVQLQTVLASAGEERVRSLREGRVMVCEIIISC
jgi:hypothetical protein